MMIVTKVHGVVCLLNTAFAIISSTLVINSFLEAQSAVVASWKRPAGTRVNLVESSESVGD